MRPNYLRRSKRARTGLSGKLFGFWWASPVLRERRHLYGADQRDGPPREREAWHRPLLYSIYARGNLTLVASHPRMKSSTVMLFFDLMRLCNGPAGTRWAALLYGCPFFPVANP